MARKIRNRSRDKRFFHKTATATKTVNNITPRGGKRF